MALIEFKDLPNKTTPINAANLNNNFKEVLNLVCPVGKVEIFYDNDDHSDYLGFTWERTGTGKAIVGIDSSDSDFSTIGKTGGSKTQSFALSDNGYAKLNLNWEGKFFGRSIGTSEWTETVVISTGQRRQDSSGTSSTGITLGGSTDSASILSPYQVFAIWKRVS